MTYFLFFKFTGVKSSFEVLVSGGGSAVVYSLFIVAHIVCGSFVFGPCFVQYSVSFLVLQSSRWGRESWLLDFIVCWMLSAFVVLCLFLTVPWVGP